VATGGRADPILPGARIGIVGSGQLGRMLALAARSMGYRVHTYSPRADSPTGQVADREHIAGYDDADEMAKFASDVDVLTFEFENISAEALSAAALHAPLRPGLDVLYVTQSRLREKRFLAKQGFPIAPWAAVESSGDIAQAIETVGLPAIGKTAGFGYDGKGQFRAHSEADVHAGWEALARGPIVLEQVVDFACELSVIAARSSDGSSVDFGAIENRHSAQRILDLSIAPAGVPPEVAEQAQQLTHAILASLDVVGVMCVEMFLAKDGSLLINELAPRPHNSGHLTLDACASSQFELQVRAVCDLPQSATTLLRPAAMANLLGDLWRPGAVPDWSAALTDPGVKLHLYGKSEPRDGRKMGHLTVLDDSTAEAARRATAARNRAAGARTAQLPIGVTGVTGVSQ
jgi:5-(carboxyamino)imidazole ribonucleotide synthase